MIIYSMFYVTNERKSLNKVRQSSKKLCSEKGCLKALQ